MWSDNKEKIRRFLRDPDGNIWTDTFLKIAFNDSQHDFCQDVGLLDSVQAISVPPQYQTSYFHDWEWSHLDQTGKVYKALLEYHDFVCCFKWEMQHLSNNSGSETEEGWAFILPFESYMITNTNETAPLWFPDDFKETKFIAWDKEPIEYKTKKEIQSVDTNYKNHSGSPQYYYREDAFSNEFRLYPKPSNPIFDDGTGSGQVLFTSELDPDSETGMILDVEGGSSDQGEGIVTDSIVFGDNILLIYTQNPENIESEDDTGSYPKYLQKYIEYGALETAYSSNTDGRISSLKDYWAWRKKIGIELVKKFKSNRYKDRDFRLVSSGSMGQASRMHPRLPDTYPDVNP